MASWKRILTDSDNSAYKNENISLAQLDAGLDGESGYGAGKILKVNGSGNAIVWSTETDTTYSAGANISISVGNQISATNTEYTTATGSTLGLIKIGYTETGKNYPVELSSGKAFVNVPWSAGISGAASVASLGAIRLHSDTESAVAPNSISTTSSRSYAIQLDANDKAAVNVPWTDTDVQLTTAQVRSKVSGTGLISYDSTSGVISTSANNYSLPLASSSRGGIKIGYSENGKNYPVELSSEKAFVNVPWASHQTTFTLTGDSGTNQTLSHGQTLDIAGGTGISTSVGATDTVTVTLDSGHRMTTANVKSVLNGNTGGMTIGDSNDTITIPGNLTVSGSTITTISETVNIEDNRITLNSNDSGYPASNDGSTGSAGLEVERGSAPNAFLTFRETGSATSTAHKGQWYMYRPYEATAGTANSNNIERLAAVESLQYKSGAFGSNDEGHIQGGLGYDTSGDNLYICTNPYVNNSGGGGG